MLSRQHRREQLSRFIQTLTCLSLVWGVTPEVTGFVYHQRTPLPHAIVHNITSGEWATTDDYGYFKINSQIGDSIRIQHYGYGQVTLPVSNNILHINLSPDPIPMDQVNVKQSHSIQTGHKSIGPHIGVNPTLYSVPSLSMRTYGGSAGIKNITLGSGLSSHTKVVWNGIDVTSPQNGESDLSQLPSFMMERISISKKPAITFGSGSIDGAIMISSPRSSMIEAKGGSFGRRSLNGIIQLPGKIWQSHIGLGQSESRGNFPYNYNGKSGKLANNSFRQSFYAMGTKRSISPHWFASMAYLFSQQTRGVSGLVFSPSPDARRKDDIHLFELKSMWQRQNHLFSISSQFRHSDESYKNPQYAVNSRHDLAVNQLSFGWQFQPNPSVDIDQLFQIKTHTISSTDTENHAQKYIAYANTLKWQIRPNLNHESSIRYDGQDDGLTAWTWQTGFSRQGIINRISLMAGNGFRFPTFNDLYWNPGGNPDLKPETSQWVRIENQFLIREHAVSLSASIKQSTNLIQWTSSGSFWTPKNIAESQRNILTITASGPLIGLLSYSGHFTYNQSEDFLAKKPLRYTPKTMGGISFHMETSQLNGWVTGHYLGERISMYSWPKDVVLNPYFIISGGVERSFNEQTSISISCENFLDTSVMTVNGYPEPGRSFSIRIQFKPQLKRDSK